MAEPGALRPAATVMVLRDGPTGMEVLMLRRSQKAGFFPHAWVFPGGRVDKEDAAVRTCGQVDGLHDAENDFAVAAVRECFEEAGVWLGTGIPPQGFRDALNSRTSTLLDAPMLVADLDRLELWSHWVTPEVEPRRYDTRFFVTALRSDESGAAQHDDIETVSSAWLTPARALSLAAAGDFFLAPPTFVTLQEFSVYADAHSAMESASARPVPSPIMPVFSKSEAGDFVVAFPGDQEHPQPDACTSMTRLTLQSRRWVPSVYTQS